MAQNTGGVAVSESHTAIELGCAAGMGVGTCSWMSSSALTNGSLYNWFVYAENAEGTSGWSNGNSITVNAGGPPAAPTLVSPSGTIATTTPTYTWNASSGATSYYLLAQNTGGVAVSESHTASEVQCASGSGTCSWTPSSALQNGSTYNWFVNASNAQGTSAWSAGNSITVNAGGIPAAPTLVLPSGTIATTTPTYIWNASSGATSYYLLAQNTGGVAVSESHTASEVGCASGSGTCSWTPSSALQNGSTYNWFVNASNAQGTSAWSAGNSITVSVGVPPAPILIVPSDTISTITPTYTWNPSSGATSYYLLVQNTSGVAVGESHTATELGCGTGTCTWTPSASLAHNTAYNWFVNATNDAGTSAWSDGKSITTQ